MLERKEKEFVSNAHIWTPTFCALSSKEQHADTPTCVPAHSRNFRPAAAAPGERRLDERADLVLLLFVCLPVRLRNNNIIIIPREIVVIVLGCFYVRALPLILLQAK